MTMHMPAYNWSWVASTTLKTQAIVFFTINAVMNWLTPIAFIMEKKKIKYIILKFPLSTYLF